MSGENGTNTEQRYALISAQIAINFIKIWEILFHFLEREASHHFLYRAILETWLDPKEPTSTTYTFLQEQKQLFTSRLFQKGIGKLKNKVVGEECIA